MSAWHKTNPKKMYEESRSYPVTRGERRSHIRTLNLQALVGTAAESDVQVSILKHNGTPVMETLCCGVPLTHGLPHQGTPGATERMGHSPQQLNRISELPVRDNYTVKLPISVWPLIKAGL